MANAATAGMGLNPTSMLGNTPAPQGQSAYKIDAAYGTAIYNGAPVISAAGYMTEGTNVTTGTASQCGVLNGVFYNAATTLKPTWDNYYAGSITPANSEDITAFIIDAPWQNYEIFSDGAITQAKFMQTFNLNAAAGSTTTGKSSNTLDIGSEHATNYSWRVLRTADDPSNSDITAAYCKLVVVANLNEFKDSA